MKREMETPSLFVQVGPSEISVEQVLNGVIEAADAGQKLRLWSSLELRADDFEMIEWCIDAGPNRVRVQGAVDNMSAQVEKLKAMLEYEASDGQ